MEITPEEKHLKMRGRGLGLKLVFAALIAVLLGASVLWLRHATRESRHAATYTAKRSAMLWLNAAVAPPQNFVALGDSITEAVYLADVCGTSFNAGIGGGKIEDVSSLADKILKRLQPRILLIAVGTNDIWAGSDIPTFTQHYTQLVEHLPKARTILMGVPNSPDASAMIRTLAAKRGAIYVPPVTGSDYTIADGAHLKPAGARMFRQRVAGACAMATNSDKDR